LVEGPVKIHSLLGKPSAEAAHEAQKHKVEVERSSGSWRDAGDPETLISTLYDALGAGMRHTPSWQNFWKASA